jgi:murein DD-endopeptidase MepM/ murein hydrolase activator NlpD
MRKLLLLGLILGFAPSAAALGVEQIFGVEIEVRAREVAPGEPLRVVVRANEALAELQGLFLGEPIFLIRSDPSDPGEQSNEREAWIGWSMVSLDQSPGTEGIEVTGTTARGRAVAGSLAVTIKNKEFPREELDVAPRYVSPPKEIEERLTRERERLAAIYRLRRPGPAFDQPFVRPVPGGPTSVFGMRRIYNGEPRSPHPGLDLRAASGSVVAASGAGRVVLAADLYYSGNTVILDHGGGLFTLYAHLSEIEVHEGDAALAGERLGLSGATGRVTGPHLHWGAKIGKQPFDPTALLDPALFR